jgi:hypothetical protein
MADELKKFKKIEKSVGSIITTMMVLIEAIILNYKLIGNNILLSNPYVQFIKIHCCLENPEKL